MLHTLLIVHRSEEAITLHFQLFSASYTVFQTKNSTRSVSTINPEIQMIAEALVSYASFSRKSSLKTLKFCNNLLEIIPPKVLFGWLYVPH